MTVVTRKRTGFALIVGGAILAVILLSVAGIACRFADNAGLTRSGRARDALSQAGATVTEHTTMAGPGLGTARVYAVDFSDTDLTNEQLAAAIPYLNDLSGVQRLNLRGTQVDDAGLASLADVKDLYVVDVTDARVTAEGIVKLRDGRVYPLVVDNSGPRAFDHEGCQDLLFSPDGNFLAIVDAQGTAVWNVEKDEQVAEFRGGSSAAFSADGSLLAIGHVNGVEVWSLLTNRQSLSLPIKNQSPSGVAFSADSKSLFVWEFGQTQQYELAKGRHLATHEGLLLGRSRTTAWFHLDPRVTKPMIHPDQGPLEGEITKELTWVAGLCVLSTRRGPSRRLATVTMNVFASTLISEYRRFPTIAFGSCIPFSWTKFAPFASL